MAKFISDLLKVRDLTEAQPCVHPQAVLARENNVDITDAVIAELNRILPNVTTTPPAGYQPGQLQQQRAQQAAPAQPAANQPASR